MKMSPIRRMTRLAILLALGVILNYMEHVLLPTAFIAPGVKLGLANTVGLIVLYFFGVPEFLFIGFLRILMTSLFTGFGFNFFIALSGWGLSSLFVVIAYYGNKFSIFGLSMISAVLHGIGQVIMVSLLYESVYMLNYLPILSGAGIISGLLIALIAKEALRRIDAVPYVES